MRSCAAWFASIAMVAAGAVALAGTGSHPSLVPWKVLEPGTPVEPSPLILFWIPASRDELRRSALLTSDELTLYSSQCVAMRVVRLDDRELLDRLGVGSALPAVVLADADGEVVARTGGASVGEVEALVRDELHDRAARAETMLDEARQKAAAGDVEGAIALYRRVWAQRCECPRQGRAAGRALRKLQRQD